MNRMERLVAVIDVKPLKQYQCLLTFEDGTQKQIDLLPFLRGPIFETILHNPSLFQEVHIVDGTIGWENGADIDPDVLYYDLKPCWMEETQEK